MQKNDGKGNEEKTLDRRSDQRLLVELSVVERYTAAAQAVEPALCCPIEYDKHLLAAIPQEVIDKDYGCGDPTPYVQAGDTVLDLGSGGGKLCFIAAQLVGPTGRVIGVDCNPVMLALARKHAPTVAETIGYANVEFRCGMIQDLQLDLDQLDQRLAQEPIASSQDYLRLRNVEEQLRMEVPLVDDESVDCVLSNCVLNLVRQRDRQQLFAEVYRVLRSGGRAAISDIVSNKTVPEAMRRDAKLWSGCLSGAFREDEFLAAFAAAGFDNVQLAKKSAQPWQTIDGIDFYSVTVLADKGTARPVSETAAGLYLSSDKVKVAVE